MKYTLLSILAIAITFPVLKTYFAFNFTEKKNESAKTQIKILSYNVRNFDLYNWTKNTITMNKIMELISESDADVACFQEFYNADTGKFQTVKKLLDEAGFKYYLFEKTVTHSNGSAWGNAIFSKYPIINSGKIIFKDAGLNSLVYCDLKIDSVKIRVINVHLQSVYLSSKDYNYINEVTEDQNVEVKPTRQIAGKLKRAFLNRENQSLKIRELLKSSKLPVIICGDFNDTPASFCYHTVSNNLNDAFLCSGLGIGATYAGIPPLYRIDYMLTSKSFSVSNYKTIGEKYSDHYPITCNISF